MGKDRKSKRQLIRDEKRAKKRGREVNDETERDAKRQRHAEDDHTEAAGDYIPLEDGETNGANYEIDLDGNNARPAAGPIDGFEREFFGMLADEEQEYFRRADELLELNDFPTAEERNIFLQNVYNEAKGKELKLASSQSCSRLMERLILLSNTRQKKRLFGAFAGHFISMVTHRFAGHCCEKLFLQSAPVVTQELGGVVVDEPEAEAENGTEKAEDEADCATKLSMEDLFLATLDELEEHLSFLLSDRYGSHALRVLLVVLSGRPLDQVSTKSLLQSRKKEYITVEGASALGHDSISKLRAVPPSFTMAINKILTDSTANLDPTALRVLAKHPTGNPALQLLLELEFSLSSKSKKETKKKDGEKEVELQNREVTLVERLIPGAPASFSDATSPASEFVNSMLYDPIGSRLLEALIAHCPGKIFKGLQANFFGPRIQSLLRNDIASYAAIQVLNRLSKEDLADAVEKSVPEMASFIEKGRFNVVKTLFERCNVRKATDSIPSLLQALSAACGGDWKTIVPKLCALNEPPKKAEEPKEKSFQQDAVPKNQAALLSHGCQVVTTLLAIPRQPAKAMQASLLALKPDQLLAMATSSHPTANVLIKALSTPSQNPNFHKVLVASLRPHVLALATSQHGNGVLNAIITTPSKGEGITVPFHLKENIMSQLEEHETELRETWLGRNAWRTWRGDLWSHRRHDWVRWAKETDPAEARISMTPKPRLQGGKDGDVAKGKPGFGGVKKEKQVVTGVAVSS
ncbi:armadillo-type protein [Apodospora peruviana]|uniref:Nucleolar protein 9 n=1 Tax=Apodospora peruviana TaxID=516989 RepID=A0AAE0IAU2_9PEZI|nr:armadillo-type protein [Apodospora peruviana]